MIFCTWYFLSGKIFYLVLKLDKFIIAFKIEQLMDKCCTLRCPGLMYVPSFSNFSLAFSLLSFSTSSSKFYHVFQYEIIKKTLRRFT